MQVLEFSLDKAVWGGISDIYSYKFTEGSIWGTCSIPTSTTEKSICSSAAEKEIEILFNKGDFQLLSEGKHIIDFHEPNLPTVDCLGIIAGTHRKFRLHILYWMISLFRAHLSLQGAA